MRLKILLLIPIFFALLIGCGAKQMVIGEFYLDMKKYEKGIETFKKDLRDNPYNASTNYYLGRFLLADGHYQEAVKYFKSATKLGMKNADYNFWLGVAYGVSKQPHLERKSYQTALSIKKKHIQALTYLGHNQLESGEYQAALKSYEKVLKLRPANPSALYNRGLIMKKFDRTPEEKKAWKEYLASYPSGSMARRAVNHLNVLGDFEYRNYIIGSRTVTLEMIQFEPFTAKVWKGSRPSLDLLGSILTNAKKITLQIVAYQKNNKPLAESRAKSIKKYLLKHFSKIRPNRIRVSWFDVPEKITVNKKTFKLEESINFFATR